MFKFNIFLFEPVCHFLKLSRVIEASMIWGYVHCALPRSDIWLLLLRSMNNRKLRFSSPEIQEQFLTIIDKVRDCKQTRQHMKYALFASFSVFFLSVKLGGCRWQRLFMEETKSGKNTLCATAQSWDSIWLNCSPTPPPWNKKIPHVPAKKQHSNS